ncbi:Plant self-incompatibility S1 [Corchorus olitorius]|uniref:S-protein homolog n=1 Tax=Corchorus olitorius TaxID=93759 RepID=A0A1R3KQ05_9ROSI|nr:Plant self-incompatibility S1 [Corchorus olitorius]
MSYINLAPFICMFFLACCMSQTLAISSAEVGPTTIFGRLRYKVHILNGFEDNAKPLLLHCRSEDDDLGNHTLWKGNEFRFKFRLHWIKITHFTCNFDWASKKLDDITVFKDGRDGEAESSKCADTGNCFWKAAVDGLYFSTNNQHWVKKFDWK